MPNGDQLRCTTAVLLTVLGVFVFTTMPVQAKSFGRIVVFGTSLSDTGNAFVLLSDPAAFGFSESCGLGTPANVPPYDALDDLLIPDGSYAKGGHHVSNGATWVEYLARGRGLAGNVRPALRNDGAEASNYAVGGARANDYPCRYNLSDQLTAYTAEFPETSADTLIIMEMGANDVRDALVSGISKQDPNVILSSALDKIGNAVTALYQQGARQFLLANIPPIGKTPAVTLLNKQFSGAADAADQLSALFNEGLSQLRDTLVNGLPGIEISVLMLDQLFQAIIANPAAYGLVNTTEACVTPNVPPYQCRKPDTYLFWDGIHPTTAVHHIMGQAAATVLFSVQ